MKEDIITFLIIFAIVIFWSLALDDMPTPSLKTESIIVRPEK